MLILLSISNIIFMTKTRKLFVFTWLTCIFGLFSISICLAEDVETSIVVNEIVTDETLSNEQASPTEKRSLENAEKEINDIIAIKPKPLRNPHALLVEMAFKFKAGGKVSNYQEVHDQYCKLARDGDADAQYAMGWMYEHGKGLTANKDTANLFYSMAAEQHHELALQSLADVAVIQMATDIDKKLPACMQPDPPQIVEQAKPVVEVTKVEVVPISERTAKLFMSQKWLYKLVNKIATKHKIDPNLVMSFIAIESGFDALATSPRNAQGLMQLIPETASRFGVKDAYKPEDNIKGGIAYLHWLLAYYQGNIELVAAAYNAGEKAVDRYKGVPPYQETKLYVKKIAKLYNRLMHPYKENWVRASPILEANQVNTSNKRKM